MVGAIIGAGLGGKAFDIAAQFGQMAYQDYLNQQAEARQHQYNLDAMEISQQYNKENMAIQQGYAAANAHQSYLYGEMSADNADARARALYNDLYSPEAKMQQLKAAGLNPALMYGSGGAGGSSSPSGAQGGGATVQNPQSAQLQMQAVQARDLRAFDISISKQAAEIAKLLAETKAITGGEERAGDLHKGNLELQKLNIKNSEYDNLIKEAQALFDINTRESREQAVELANQATQAGIESVLFQTERSKGMLETEMKILQENHIKIQKENAILEIQERWGDKLNDAQIKHLTANWQAYVFGDKTIGDLFGQFNDKVEGAVAEQLTNYFETEKKENHELNEIFEEGKKGNFKKAVKKYLAWATTQNNPTTGP